MPTIDHARIEHRVDDWVVRLNDLFARVERYYEQLPEKGDLRLLRGESLQRAEPLMTQFEVPPRLLPNLAVVSGRHHVSFVPSALWVIGSNGRVNVTTRFHQYMLVDLGQEGAPEWRLVTSRLRAIHQPFDYELFRQLVLKGEIDERESA